MRGVLEGEKNGSTSKSGSCGMEPLWGEYREVIFGWLSAQLVGYTVVHTFAGANVWEVRFTGKGWTDMVG